MEKLLAIGLMSGTSLDGIDAVLVQISGKETFEIIKTNSVGFSEKERKALFDACSIEYSNVEKICALNMYLAERYAQIVNELIAESPYTNDEIAFISSHGQTIYHMPNKSENIVKKASTLQIGDLSVLAQLTGIGVIGDFRPADMSVNGQGAPLTSYADYFLFQHKRKTRAIQNIGGIGNVTYLPKDGTKDHVKSFDTGPGNMIIDEIVYRVTKGEKSFDHNGELAAKGEINQQLLKQMMRMDYMKVKPPKTTGRELFGKDYVDKLMKNNDSLSNADLITTVSEFTVQSIVYHYRKYLEADGPNIDELILGGGGTFNRYITKRLSEALPETKVYRHEDFNISSEFKEALAFVILGYQALKAEYNMLPAATGADESVIMGKVAATQPEMMKRLLEVSMFSTI